MKHERGLSASAVWQLIQQYGFTWWLILPLNLGVPLILIMVFWGVWDPLKLIVFSLTTVSVAAYYSWHGWEPWNMTIEQSMRGARLRPETYSAAQLATVALFRSRRSRTIQFGWIASGTFFSWLVSGVSTAFRFPPLRPSTPWWAIVFVGLFDALRGRSIALRYLALEFKRHWEVLRGSGDDAHRGLNRENVTTRVSEGVTWTAMRPWLLWFFITLVVACVFGYMQGLAHRPGR